MNAFYNEHMLPCIDRFLAEIEGKIYTPVAALNAECYLTKEPVSYEKRTSGIRKTIGKDEKWGDLWDCAWFHFTGRVPEEARGKKTVLKIDLSGEALVYDENGVPMQGLTSVTDSFDALLGSPAKTTLILSENAAGGEAIDLWADAGCNDLFGRFQTGTLRRADISVCNEPLRMLWYDMRFLRILLEQLEKNSARYVSVLHALFTASLITDYDQNAVEGARKVLKRELDKKGGDPSLKISALGHSHLDLAWLWPLRETKRKALRTFATAIRNLERYPDYLFCASQPQQLEWVKENAPELYAEIREMVKAGRIEPVGAMWVEPDLNVSGGEALIRQVLYGKKFFKQEFGIEVDNAWLPDVFGFNAALPQILAKSGVKNLLTIKLSWNKYTKFPHHSFVWKGPDGASEVLVHMPPEGTYNSAASPLSVKKAETLYIEKGISENAMMLFGIGDGGGGPGSSHLENLKRMKNAEGLCPVKQTSAKEFFRKLNAERKKLPVYKGEMYLQKHQGTYTTQAHNKQNNRDMETLLTTAELLSVIAAQKGFEYPEALLETLWKETLLYQFHDILPGSSISRVYEENAVRYDEMKKQAKHIISSALDAIGKDRDAYFNPTSFHRSELISRGGSHYRVECLPFGKGLPVAVEKGKVKASDTTLENECVKFVFGKNGELLSAYDKRAKKRILTLGNKLNVYHDDGDCWDISDNYRLKPHGEFTLDACDTVCDGVTAVRYQTLRFGDSTLKQTITLKDGEDTLSVVCEADWRENAKMLRADFVTDVVSDTVACDVQFGRTDRTTLDNTVEQYAINEICAQKWIDYAQPDCGVALLSDCKYGYSAKHGKLSIDLLRAPDYPGQGADRGTHTFTYQIYLHGAVSAVEQKAYALNHSLIECSKEMPERFLAFDSENVVIESVKKCEYDDGVIVRLYENRGCDAEGTLTHAFSQALETDMTEIGGTQVKGTLKFRPFEIKTIKLLRSKT